MYICPLGGAHDREMYAMKMLAQNPGGGTISAQEFATARQDLTTLLENPGGYVPEQVAAINERVQLQRQRQRERIARQRQFAQASNMTGVLSAAPDPGLGSVAFGLGSWGNRTNCGEMLVATVDHIFFGILFG
jgi:hypothetical protein